MYTVVHLNNSDMARKMARIHVKSLPNSFLASLGEPFLSLVYEAIVYDDDIVSLGALKGNEVAGFIVGGKNLKRAYAKLLRKPFTLLAKLLKINISISKLVGAFRTVIYSFIKKDSSANRPAGANVEAELFLLAVDANYRKSGVATLLFSCFENELHSKNLLSFRILVGSELKTAQCFYSKMGAKHIGNVDHHKKCAYIYIKKLAL